MNSENNKLAVDLAKYYFQETKQRTTKQLMLIAISQAKALLEDGFTHEEIKQGIDYYVKNPPKKGFYSLGFLNYCLPEALKKIEAEKKRLAMYDNFIQENSVQLQTTNKIEVLKEQERVSNDFNFDLFNSTKEIK